MFQLILAILMVLISSGLCSGTEAALFSVSLLRVRQLAESNDPRAKALLSIKENLNRPIASIVILNNIANIGGSIAVGSIATAVLGDAWLALVSGVLTFLVIIFSEIIPKTLGERYAERIALLAARPVQGITYLLKIVVLIVEILTSPLTKGQTAPTTDEAEIKLLARIGQQEGIIEDNESAMIERVFHLNDVTAGNLMTPRVAVTHLAGALTLGEAKTQIIQSPHSRILVTGQSIDEVLGVVLRNELLTALIEQKEIETIADFKREVQFVPEAMCADDLLPVFQESRQHLAAVFDEFGGLAGVITLEDVLETLTGQIVDETDKIGNIREATRKHRRLPELR